MKCLKKIIIGFGIFSPVLLSALFVSPSYAISDYSVSFYKADRPIICYNNDTSLAPVSCSDYSYFYVTSSLQPVQSDINLRFVLGSRNVVMSPFYSSSSVYLPLSSFTYLQFDGVIQNYNLVPADTLITVTLTDSLGESCSDPEEPEPCPVVPENPYDDKLDNITMAIYTCGGILLVLYFFYCIYRMIIKNSGVNNL